MRSFLLCLAIVFAVLPAMAQPTITSTSLSPGEVFVFYNMSITGFPAPATGANKTWDYSAVADSGGYTIDSFKAVSSTPYGSLFPAANIALLTTLGSYGYYQNSSSNFATVGFILPGTDTAYYSKPLSNVHFPFTYNSVYKDSAKYFSHSTGRIDTTKEIIKQQGTGYGTLKLPGGHTYSNVLQVTSQTIHIFSFGNFSFTDTSTSVTFLQQGSNFYLMSVSLNSQGEVEDAQYLHTGAIVTTDYTFTGNGNWNNAANWSGGKVPPSTVPSGSKVIISPQAGGKCIINVPVTVSTGATFTVKAGALLTINGNLIITKQSTPLKRMWNK